MSFDVFVGIDWSGAKGPRLPGIQVACCESGESAPRIIENQNDAAWRRIDLADWLVKTIDSGRKLLVGLDFSFSFPFVDEAAYFPGVGEGAGDARELWRLVDTVSGGADDFYAAGFARSICYAPYFHRAMNRGGRFRARYRRTERRCAEKGLGAPETMYKLIGPKQVGLGSLAGMRFLYHLHDRTHRFSVWPFESRRTRSVLVDIFPRAFLARAGAGNHKVPDLKALNRILPYFASEPAARRQVGPPGRDWGDRADALVSAAALRALADDDSLWHPNGLSEDVRRTEGWIFGVD